MSASPLPLASLSPYHRYNLVRNPFGELTREQRAELAVVPELESYLTLLAPGGRVALQFIGDCGRGKSTHLLHLAARLPAASYVYFPEDGRRPPLPAGTSVLVVDEAQRMGWLRQIQMIRSGRPLVLGTHRDLSRLLSRGGYAVTTIALDAAKSPDEIAEICNRRIAAAALDPLRPVPSVGLTLARELVTRRGSDVRAIEAELYDSFQATAKKGLAWPPA